MTKAKIYVGSEVVEYKEGENCKKIMDDRPGESNYPVIKIILNNETMMIYKGIPYSLELDVAGGWSGPRPYQNRNFRSEPNIQSVPYNEPSMGRNSNFREETQQ